MPALLDQKKWPLLLTALGIGTVMLLAYGRSLSFDFAPIDDYDLVTHNLAVREISWRSLERAFTTYDPELYIPLTFLSFQATHAIAGMHAWVFHLVNLLLHAANALLVFRLTWFLFSSSRSQDSQLKTRSFVLALFATLLFAVHPLHTESIVWISARKDLLATFFVLLTVLSVLRALRTKRHRWWLIGLFAFLCSLLSKVTPVALPILLIVLLAREGMSVRRALVRTLPFFGLSLVAGIIALLGKDAVVVAGSLTTKTVLAAVALGLTSLRLLWPIRLHPFYPVPPVDIALMTITLLPMLLLTFAWFMRRRSPLVTLGLAWFFLFLLPTTANIQTDLHAAGATFGSDRYAYLPSIGILIALQALVGHCLDRSSLMGKRALVGCALLIAALFVVLSGAQTNTWRSADALFTHALTLSPTSIEARTSLARLWREQDRLQEAFDLLKEGLRYGDHPRLHLAAGFLFAKAGQVAEAEEEFTRAREKDPASAEPFYALAGLRAHEDRLVEAETLYRAAIEREPAYVSAHVELARLLLEKGKPEQAQEHLTAALKADPDDIDALKTMGAFLRSQDKAEEAKRYERDADLLDS